MSNGKHRPFSQGKRKMCWWITEKCNEGCVYCFRSLDAKNRFTFEEHMAILDGICGFGTEQVTWSGGEALLVPHAPELIAEAKSRGIFNKVTTNGKLLTPEAVEKLAPHVDLVALSIDSFDDDVNRMLGRGAEQRGTVEDRMRLLRDAGIAVDVNTVVMRQNIGTLDEMAHALSENPVSGKWKLMTFFPVRARALENKDWLSVPDEEFVERVHALIDEYPELDIVYMMNDQIQQQYPGVRANGDLLVTRNGVDTVLGNMMSGEGVPNPFEWEEDPR